MFDLFRVSPADGLTTAALAPFNNGQAIVSNNSEGYVYACNVKNLKISVGNSGLPAVIFDSDWTGQLSEDGTWQERQIPQYQSELMMFTVAEVTPTRMKLFNTVTSELLTLLAPGHEVVSQATEKAHAVAATRWHSKCVGTLAFVMLESPLSAKSGISVRGETGDFLSCKSVPNLLLRLLQSQAGVYFRIGLGMERSNSLSVARR